MTKIALFKKNIFIWLLLSLLFFNCEREDNSAKTVEGDVILTSQGEINEFGKNNYIRVKGNVFIGPYDTEGNLDDYETDIISLDGLSNIDSIDGELQICRNYKLINVDECLNNLTIVRRGIVIFENTNLRSMNGFNNLIYVTNINIINQYKFVEIKGFSNLTELDGNIVLSNIQFLENIDGFSNLTKIGGRLEINYCDALTGLPAFLNLKNIGYDLILEMNSNLQSLEGFKNLTSLGNSLGIRRNNKLKNLDGLGSIIKIPGQIWLEGNNELTDLGGINNLTSIGGTLWLENNNSLTHFNGFSNLDTVWGSVRIEYNNALLDVDSLSNLAYIGESLTMVMNENIQNIDGFTKVSYVGNNLELRYNAALNNFCGLRPFFTNGTLGGYCSMGSNSYTPSVNDIIDGNCSQQLSTEPRLENNKLK
jgi:hypothetical protein